jgi:hypothetical protein
MHDAEPASNSCHFSEPLLGIHQARTQPRPDKAIRAPKGASQGGWTKGNSESARICAGAAEYLRETGRRARSGEIYKALVAKGVSVGGTKPFARVSSRLGRSPLFDRTRDGYGLREWSNGPGPLLDYSTARIDGRK